MSGSSQTVTWTMSPAVSSGYFRLFLQDTTSGAWTSITPSASPIAAVAGQTSYSTNWNVTQAAGTYKLCVYYYSAGGTQLTGAVSSGAVTITMPPTPTLTSPNSGSFVSGASPTVTWTMSSAVSSGYFRLFLQDTTSGAWTSITPSASPIAAVAGQTSYSTSWNVTQAAGTYKLWVYYYSASGTQLTGAASSGSITISAVLALTLTSPGSGTFVIGNAQTVTWTMSPAVSSGYFRLFLRDTTSGAWTSITPSASPIAAVAGQTSYSTSWNVTQAAGTYKLWVYQYSSGGTQLIGAASSGSITIIAPPTLTSPSSGTFVSGSSQTVTWTMSPAVSSGYFRLFLRDTTSGAWATITPSASPIAAVAGQTSYSTSWNVAQAAGTYKLWVYYYSAGGTQLTGAVSSGTVTIIATPTLTSPSSGSFVSGSSQTVTWTMSPAVSSGYFRLFLRDTTSGAWATITPSASPIAAVAGQTSYSTSWNVAQAAGTYKLWVYYYSAGGTQLTGAVSSGTVTIIATPTLTSPNSGSFVSGDSPAVTWTMSSAVSSGYFRLFLRDTTSGAWTTITPSASPIAAVAGQTQLQHELERGPGDGHLQALGVLLLRRRHAAQRGRLERVDHDQRRTCRDADQLRTAAAS